MTYSGQLGVSRQTRSPRDTPSAASARAKRLVRASSSRYVRLAARQKTATFAGDYRHVLGMAGRAVREHLIVRNARILERRAEELEAHRARARSRSAYFC